MTRERFARAAGALALACAPLGAGLAAYPEKAIRLIVPVAPGGTVDIVARTLAEPISKSLGQAVVVENRPSASSLVGTQLVAKSAPDGYTLLTTSTTFLSAPAIVANPGYDPIRDFIPVTLTARAPMMLAAHPSLPVNTLGELVALAKAKPGELTTASSGNGSTGHMAAELFAYRAGVKFNNIFYKGSAQALTDVVGGQTMMLFDQIGTTGPQARSGKLRAIAVTTLVRSPLFPEIPTIAESGYPGYEDVTINLMLAPAGTPRDIVNRLHAEVVKAWTSRELVNRFAERGIELKASSSPEEFAAYVRAEVEKFARLAREVGIKPE
ncbi:MAG TPA: tripartite tricarboxylate transporter substrate binding protein [Burkholderiales bacterium]|nr:tripartite tricarboxylate transporter substrate binding protein [Burkholderiales bacterium]